MEPTQTEMCKCGHTDHWHGDGGAGSCEFDGDCTCWRFRPKPTAVDLFREYRLDWEAALNPCMMCLLENCPDSEKVALHALFDSYMEEGHESPPYSPVQCRRLADKMQSIMDRVKADPAVMADDDQRAAKWRDTPWWRKRWSRFRLWWFLFRLRVQRIGKKARWE